MHRAAAAFLLDLRAARVRRSHHDDAADRSAHRPRPRASHAHGRKSRSRAPASIASTNPLPLYGRRGFFVSGICILPPPAAAAGRIEPEDEMKKMPIQKYRPYHPVDLPDRTWPSRTITRGPALVQRRPPRRQPGARRADGPGAEAAHVRDPGRHGLQGDRGRLPELVAARLRLRALADRVRRRSPTTSRSRC